MGIVAAGSFAALALFLAPQSFATPGQDVMTAPVPPGYYAVQKVVYQNDGPADPAYFERMLRNLAAHLQATGGKVEIRVVDFGPGVTLFQMAKTDPKLAGAIDGLLDKGVRFLICRNTLRGMSLKPSDLYGVKDADVVPSGVAELARLQGQGWAYIHP